MTTQEGERRRGEMLAATITSATGAESPELSPWAALLWAVSKVGRFWVYRSLNLYACSLFTALPLCQGLWK